MKWAFGVWGPALRRVGGNGTTGLRSTLSPGPSQKLDLSQEHIVLHGSLSISGLAFLFVYSFVFGKTECLDQGPGVARWARLD